VAGSAASPGIAIVRLNITDASDGPTLWEFQLFE
jgi:hypothetical protein